VLILRCIQKHREYLLPGSLQRYSAWGNPSNHLWFEVTISWYDNQLLSWALLLLVLQTPRGFRYFLVTLFPASDLSDVLSENSNESLLSESASSSLESSLVQTSNERPDTCSSWRARHQWSWFNLAPAFLYLKFASAESLTSANFRTAAKASCYFSCTRKDAARVNLPSRLSWGSLSFLLENDGKKRCFGLPALAWWWRCCLNSRLWSKWTMLGVVLQKGNEMVNYELILQD